MNRAAARAEGEMNDTDARLWHPWLRINRVLRVMLHTRWRAEAWSQVRVEFKEGARAEESDPARSGSTRMLREPAVIQEGPTTR